MTESISGSQKSSNIEYSTVANEEKKQTQAASLLGASEVQQNEGDMQAKLNAAAAKVMETMQASPPEKGYIVYRILNLLQELLPAVQRAAAAQANYMSAVPSAMVSVYTDMISKVQFYTKDQEKDDKTREDHNAQQSRYVDKLKSYREYFQDLSKKTQTNMNTTNECANSVIDLFTTLTQQIKEIMSMIANR